VKDQWTVETERMKATVVSEPAKLPSAMMARLTESDRKELPSHPTYVLLTRPGGTEPIRIEAEDAELLMWLLLKLARTSRQYAPTDFGALIGPPLP
jgi:hypothetical protein